MMALLQGFASTCDTRKEDSCHELQTQSKNIELENDDDDDDDGDADGDGGGDDGDDDDDADPTQTTLMNMSLPPKEVQCNMALMLLLLLLLLLPLLLLSVGEGTWPQTSPHRQCPIIVLDAVAYDGGSAYMSRYLPLYNNTGLCRTADLANPGSPTVTPHD
jgi:hypothetical protein